MPYSARMGRVKSIQSVGLELAISMSIKEGKGPFYCPTQLITCSGAQSMLVVGLLPAASEISRLVRMAWMRPGGDEIRG